MHLIVKLFDYLIFNYDLCSCYLEMSCTKHEATTGFMRRDYTSKLPTLKIHKEKPMILQFGRYSEQPHTVD